jgi:hypothetical protein
MKDGTLSIAICFKVFKIYTMKKGLFLFAFIVLTSYWLSAQSSNEEEVRRLSTAKWQWMADKNTDSLNLLFDEKSMFVHMGGSWGKTQELKVIKEGTIWYKKAEVYSVIINQIGNTVILLNELDLTAVVGGNEVINPFMVTEVYVKENGQWKMGSLTFSKLLRPVKTATPSK